MDREAVMKRVGDAVAVALSGREGVGIGGLTAEHRKVAHAIQAGIRMAMDEWEKARFQKECQDLARGPSGATGEAGGETTGTDPIPAPSGAGGEAWPDVPLGTLPGATGLTGNWSAPVVEEHDPA